jgi:hypothetical protein
LRATAGRLAFAARRLSLFPAFNQRLDFARLSANSPLQKFVRVYVEPERSFCAFCHIHTATETIMSEDDKEWLANVMNDPSRQTKTLTHEGVELYPLAGYSTATLSATGALLRIEFVVPPPHTGTRVLNLGMTRQQCTELAQSLTRLALLPHKASEAKN